jgi:hypothetical protein
VAPKRSWVRDPGSGGMDIPAQAQARIRKRILDYANAEYAGRFESIDVRFKGKFCYIDAYLDAPEPYHALLDATGETVEQYLQRMKTTPTHMVRLRYYGDEERWGLAFFAYGSEKYELTMFQSGDWYGTIEEAFDIGSVYLQG